MTRIIATRFGRRSQRPARSRHDDGFHLPRAILGSLAGEVIELIVAASIAALSAGSALAAHLRTLAASH